MPDGNVYPRFLRQSKVATYVPVYNTHVFFATFQRLTIPDIRIISREKGVASHVYKPNTAPLFLTQTLFMVQIYTHQEIEATNCQLPRGEPMIANKNDSCIIPRACTLRPEVQLPPLELPEALYSGDARQHLGD